VVCVRLRRVKKVSRKLANGRIETYWYAWVGGPRLEGKPGSPEFIASYNRAAADRQAVPKDILKSIIAKFRASADYTQLSVSSKRAYATYLSEIEVEFGEMPLAVLADPRVRGDFLEWRDGMSETPRKADYAWTVLARLLSFGKNRGLIGVNPCERGGRLYRADRADLVWTDETLDRLFAVSSREVAAVVTVALWTGQRQGDVLRLPWSSCDGSSVRLKQSKTGRRVVVPITAALRETIESLPQRGPIMLTSSDGRPWTSDGFRASFGKACAKAGIDQLTFHDLRGTAVTRLAIAGCTESEIAAITGHSLKGVSEILDRHYLSRDNVLGENAMRKLETITKVGKRQENGSAG
jgi:integrase